MKRFDHKEVELGRISSGSSYNSCYEKQRKKRLEEISEEGWELVNTLLIEESSGDKAVIGYFKKSINLKESLLERYK